MPRPNCEPGRTARHGRPAPVGSRYSQLDTTEEADFRMTPRHRFVAAWHCAVLALGLVTVSLSAPARPVTDATGRQVDVPDRVERVYPAGPPASVLLYVLA